MGTAEPIEAFRRRLDAYYAWPAIYPFKFIVPNDQLDALIAFFPDDPVVQRPSRNGNYVAVTIEMQVRSADQVIAIYQRVSRIPRLISL